MADSQFAVKARYTLQQPEWSKNAVIYQVNIRQFSQEGDFLSVISRLADIKALGVDIIYLMPIHPIGEKRRKGELGSPYAVKDYYGVNPEFGSPADLKKLIEAAHSLHMKVIIDWVGNHSAWDNPLTIQHPDWYARDHAGDFRPSPWWDWDDIIEFDYNQPDLCAYMIDALCYWVREYDIDGYRCDVAGYVPTEFWDEARHALDDIKPVFMLAEWEDRDLHEQAFNMTYAWSWNEVVHGIAHQRLPLDKLRKYYAWNERSWPNSAYRMTFVSNHDKNAWDGTQREQFADALEAAIVLSVIGEGMPLIHNGQEAGETKRLAFFSRDPIEWQPHPIGRLYLQLISLKKAIPALWNGPFGATMIQIPNSHMQQIFSFVRQDPAYKVLVILNFSDKYQQPAFTSTLFPGDYVDGLSGTPVTLSSDDRIDIEPWAYRVLIQQLE